MVKLNVDCCSVTAQDNEPRVTFTTRKFLSIQDIDAVQLSKRIAAATPKMKVVASSIIL